MGIRRFGAMATYALALATGVGGCYTKNDHIREPLIQKPLMTESPKQNPVPINSERAGKKCYYQVATPGQPFDYALWQGKRSCAESTCAPPQPTTLKTNQEVIDFEKRANAVRPKFKKLPNSEKELSAFINQAQKDNRITRAKKGDRTIYDAIQREIDSARPEQTVHIVFGFTPAVEGQTAFFNELLHKGKDGYKINGITHIAEEMTNSAQAKVDRYLFTGDIKLMIPLESRRWEGFDHSPMASDAEVKERSRTFEIAQTECIDMVMPDIPQESRGSMDFYYLLGAREEYAAEWVGMRLNPGTRNVVFWRWGASHAEKNRLPFYIKIQDPDAKVVSVVLNGGSYVDAYAFDRVLRGLGWLDDTFILKLEEGDRDAKYIFHIPTNGRERMWGISTIEDPVISHIFDSPAKK